jgi:osmotically-inducible protein OsmY
MGKMLNRRWLWPLLLAATACAGCEAQDTDKLAHAARKVADKVQALAEGADVRWLDRLQAMAPTVDAMDVTARVQARVRWDKALAESRIAVSAKDGVVELKGTVRDLDQKRRAVEIAESTQGVEKVNDALELGTGSGS